MSAEINNPAKPDLVVLTLSILTMLASAISFFSILVLFPEKGLYLSLFMVMDLLKIAGAAGMLMLRKPGFYIYTIGEIFRTALIPLVFAWQTAHTDFGMESSLAGRGTIILFFSVIFGLIWILGYGSRLSAMK